MIAMSVSMKWGESETETVPLDLTMKKEENYAVSEAEVELDGPGKLTEDTTLLQSIAENDVQSTPLDLSARRALPLQSPPPPSPPSMPQPQCGHYRTPVSPSPTEHLAPLHGMYSNAAAYQNKVSSAAVPEYNTSPPVLPTSTANEFHQNNRIQQQLEHLHMQQQQLLHLQNQLKLQQQLQSQLHQLCNGQKKLQLQAAYGGVPLNPTSSPSSSVSNHFQSPTADDHHQQWDLDPDHRPHIEACATDDADVVDPEEVAAIYRQSEFLSLRQRYMESLRPPRNINKIRRSSNNSNNNNNNNNNNNDDNNNSSNDNDNHGLTAGQQQNDQTSVMKRKRNNEAARRSWGAKRQKYFENQVKVMYLNKKVNEMKDIKKRLLKANGNILAK